MKVAIAGTGNVAQYLIEELKARDHQLVVLSRSSKPAHKDYEPRQTDYSIGSLVKVLEDVDALVSAITPFVDPNAAAQSHMNMLEAVEQSKTSKTFIPSEWTVNMEDFPDQPMVLSDVNAPLYAKLKASKNVRWTIISTSWFADYVLPKQQRHLVDIGSFWPMDYENKVFTIYGPGTQLVDFTPVRDVAKAVGAMLESNEPWDQYTYISGDQLTWNELFAAVKKHDPRWTSKTKSVVDTIKQIVDKKTEESELGGYFEIQSYSGANTLPKEKVQKQRAKFFKGIHFRTVNDILDEAAKNPDKII